MDNPYILSPPPLPADVSGLSARDLRWYGGGNTGNFLFLRVFDRVLAYERLDQGYGLDPADLRERHDGIVVAAANWLSPRHDFSDLVARVEASDLPVMVVGVGAQSRNPARIPELQPSTLRLMQIASERSESISVRGDYTAEVLAHHGIENVAVTGCPSLLWNLDSARRVEKQSRPVTRVALNSSRGVADERLFTEQAQRAQTVRLNLLLPRIAYERDLDFVVQAERPEMDRALAVARGETVPEDDGYLGRVYDTADSERLEAFLARRVKLFLDVEAWLAYLAGQELVFGTRLHGVIASLLAGTPAILVTHDTRTAEMARTAAIPSLDAESVFEDIDFQAEYDACDVDTFNANLTSYQRRFAAFFEANGLRHRLETHQIPATEVSGRGVGPA